MRCVLLFAGAAVAAPPVPQLPQQWQAFETDEILINQGGEVTGDAVCCEFDAASCKVQTAKQATQFYFDGPNNRTRTGPAGTTNAIVSDYISGKEMQVDANNTCTSYCPLQGGLAPFSIDAKAKYVGAVTMPDGSKADEWMWKEYIIQKLHLGLIQQTNFFVSSGANPVPLAEQDIIEPLGQQIGTENQTWAQFKAGAPPASLFTVGGADSCKVDPNCQQPSLEAHRRRARDVLNLAYYRYPQVFLTLNQNA